MVLLVLVVEELGWEEVMVGIEETQEALCHEAMGQVVGGLVTSRGAGHECKDQAT